MASPLSETDTAALGGGRDTDGSVDTESGSSYIGSDAPQSSPVPCRWRTSSFWDQECSRYFDCPTHIVERLLSTDDASSQHSGSDAGPVVEEDRFSVRSSDETPQPHAELSLRVRPSQDGITDTTEPNVPQQATTVPLPASRASSLATPASTSVVPEPASLIPVNDIMDRPHLHSHFSAPATTESVGELQSGSHGQDEEPEDLPVPPGHTRPSLSVVGREDSIPYSTQTSETTGGRSTDAAVPEHTSGRRIIPEFVVPRWQPDAEVTYCPICQSQFNIFVRKHHCRKCGRVVCNSCSPHRIIIPHQYIVRPPGYEMPMPPSLFMDGLAAGYFGPNGPSGGERVRLCNPCVPDPNTAPPQSPTTTLTAAARARNRRSLGDPYVAATQRNRYGTVFTGSGNEPHRAYRPHASRTRSITVHSNTGQQPAVGTTSRRSSAFYQPPSDRIMSGSSSAAASSYPSRYAALGDGGSSSRPVPQIAEEDECPICHRELPSRTLPDFENLREAHINSCIQTHSTYGSPRNAVGGNTPPAAPRRTGMYAYPATEKDCIDDAECTICLEEFTVGVQMARLECLCRFHRSCISAWFVNHPGRCPVHQHDGFGY